MTSLTNNDVAYGLRRAEIGAEAVAHSRGYHLATVAMRISALVIVPALFWSSIVAIIL